jgi:hypothetical protein
MVVPTKERYPLALILPKGPVFRRETISFEKRTVFLG